MADTKKILWPIDPVGSEPKANEQIANFISRLEKSMAVEIQPVHVLSAEFFVTGEYFEPLDVEALKKNIQEECEAYLKDFNAKSILPPQIIENYYSARGSEVQFFHEYVKEQNPDFVLLNSHGRKGWARAFMGSFAEGFMTNSQTPIMVIGPQYEMSDKPLTHALMPVELSDSSRQFVEKFLDDHRLSFLKNLCLFHKISMVDLEDIAWAPTLYGLSDFAADDVLDRARATSQKYFHALMDHPLSQKRLSYLVSESLEPVALVIDKEANKLSSDLVVMRSEAGALEANILGSVTREVIRDAKQGVVVYPHLFKK